MWSNTNRRVYPGAGMSISYAYPPSMNGGVPSAMDGYGSMHGSFAFKKRFERIDWKKIASTDIDSISRNLDFNALQDNIMNITFCNIESEVDTRMMDPNFLKLFKLAQLTIEYLLHSQDYLSSMVGSLETKLKKAIQEHEETKKTLEKNQSELAEVKKECHKRKKMLMAQQQILQAGANAYNKCTYCSKAFINLSFLQSHMARRHPEYVGQSPYSNSLPTQHIVPPHGESQGQVDAEKNEALLREMNEIKERLRLTESQLVEERNARNTLGKQDRDIDIKLRHEREAEMEKWKKEQHGQHQEEVEQMKNMFMKELKEMNEKYQAQSTVVDKLQGKLNNKSLLGDLEDDMRYEKDELRKQREEVAMLKEELQSQVKSMDKTIQAQMKDKDRKWQDRMKHMEKQHQMQIEELSDALEQSVQDIEKDEVQVRVQYQKSLQEANNALEHSNEIDKVHIEQDRQTKVDQQRRNESEQQAIKDQVKKATSTPQGMGRMEPPSDDETTEMKEATNTMDTAGPSTLRTLQGTSKSGEFDISLLESCATGRTGSLSLNATRQAQLMEAIKKNPEFLKGMKKQLTSVFEDMLEKRGIPKGCVGMSSMEYTKKAGILKQERHQKAAKLPNFWDIRQQYIGEVDHLARQRYQQERKNHPQSKVNLSSSVPLPRSGPAPRPQSSSHVSSPGPRQAAAVQRSHSQPPKPSPRSTLQSNKSSPGHNKSQDYSQASETVTGSQWESSEEEDSEDEETESDIDETETGYDEPDNRPRQQQGRQGQAVSQGQRAGARQTTTATTRKVTTTTTTKTSNKKSESFDDDDDDDDDWDDDISELQDVMDPETPRPKASAAKPQMRGGTPTRARGENVARLSASLEGQLYGRSAKKPAGGVDVMDKNKNKQKPEELESFSDDESDDESLPTISDVDDQPKPKPSVRQAATRSSTHTDYSTNTYGTSAWGTGSKAASTVQGSNTRASVNKSVSKASTSGDVELSDWDSDEDMQMKDL